MMRLEVRHFSCGRFVEEEMESKSFSIVHRANVGKAPRYQLAK